MTTDDPATSPSWPPLLTGDDAAAANAAIDAIVRDIRAADPSDSPSDLAGGSAGIAMFFAYLGQARDSDDGESEHQKEAERWLEASIQGLSTQPYGPALHGGYAGVGWAASHLCDEETASEVCSVVDEALLQVLATPAADRDYDFIAGLAGIGLYGLTAAPTATRDQVRTTVLDQIEQLAVSDLGGLAWYTPPTLLPQWQREICPEGYFNLGLGHGVPGIIGTLAGYVSSGIDVPRATRLLEGAVHWMLAAGEPRDHGRWAAWRGVGAGTEPARLAWCYGDPGVVAPLLMAARACGRDDWEREARGVLDLMVGRPHERAGIVDGGMCHGAGGLAHIYNRLGRATGNQGALESARHWFRHLFTLARPGEGVGGFLMYRGNETPQWAPDLGLLNGGAGIGLALLGAVSAVEPSWDQSMLLDVAPAA